MQALPQLEFVRAFENYFRIKGGAGPNIPQEVVPVVILDDTSKGPFPPSRTWFAGIDIGPLAANFDYIGIVNADSSGVKSVVVVDEIWVAPGVADVVVIGVSNISGLPYSSLTTAFDPDEDKDQQASVLPVMGNVQLGTLQQVAAIGTVQFGPLPINPPVSIPGPFTLGGQATLFVRPNSVNEGITAFFRGRYYPAT